MERLISKSPKDGFVVRIITDLTKDEVVENLKGMEAAVQNGVMASEEKKAWAAAIKG